MHLLDLVHSLNPSYYIFLQIVSLNRIISTFFKKATINTKTALAITYKHKTNKKIFIIYFKKFVHFFKPASLYK